MNEEIQFPCYLQFKDRTYSVQGYIGQVGNYLDNKGYINPKDMQIYICSKDLTPAHNDVPILYVHKSSKSDENGSYTISEETLELHPSLNPLTMEAFTVEKMYDLSINSIVDRTRGDEVLYNDEAIRDMNAATSVFVPIINDDDDPLKKIIKQVIISKQIDINRLKHRMPKKYGLTNIKSALIGTTKMSIQNFCIWCELLGIDFTVSVNDNGNDPINPLFKDVVYTSRNNKLSNGED
jgi:hypothetical protein